MNNIQLLGRTGSEPVREQTTEGTPVTKLRLAVQRRPTKADQDRGAVWVGVTCYGRLAEVVAEHVGLGRQIAVTGRLEHDTWVAEDGTNRERHHVIADSVDFLARPNGNGQAA